MKTKLFTLILAVLALFGGIYIVHTLQKMVPTDTQANNVNLKTEPFRIYGLIEPENRAVYINPPVTKRIDLRLEIEKMNRDIIVKLCKKWIDLLKREIG